MLAGRFAGAVEVYERALALSPSNSKALHGLGNALYHSGQLDRAVVSFRESCEIAGARGPCAMLAVSLLRLDRREEAVEGARSAAVLSDNGHGDCSLARFWALMGDAEKSLHHLMRLDLEVGPHPDLLIDPDFVTLHGRPEFDAFVAKIKGLSVEE